MTTFEVQFKDGFNAWRRWSRVSSREAAERSLARLNTHMGSQLVALGFTRIVERAANERAAEHPTFDMGA